jgi:glutathione-regulated potassium-efflux system protein KefB
VAATAALLAAAGLALGLAPAAALVVGYGLALSSTALVLPLLAEHELLASPAGRDAFGALLFQDLAVIPMIALLPMLGVAAGAEPPGWLGLLQGAATLAAIFAAGRFLVGPLFRAVEAAKTRELFSATALLIVLGTALLAELAGLSMSLGAFLAGVLLSDSEYRHELQADIEPFESLLLGLFFVAMGMGADLAPLAAAPLAVLAAAAGLIAAKGAVVFALARLLGRGALAAVRAAVVLAQGGEFALVLFGFAAGGGALDAGQAQWISLVVILSMAATPILFAAEERWLAPRLDPGRPARAFDEMPDEAALVIICGFGRVGQVVGRILRMRGVPFTALDSSPEQIDVVRRFGNKVYYGDPSRSELLRAAGAERAKTLIVAVDGVEQSLKIVEVAQRDFPHMTIFARARDRRHAHLLMDRGVDTIVRETFHSSLAFTEALLVRLGLGATEARRVIETFRERDERTLREQHAIYRDEKQLIQSTQDAAAELAELLSADRPDSAPQVDQGDAGGGERHSQQGDRT